VGTLRVLVRAKKDASAVRHAVDAIVKDPYVEVESLGGARGERLCELAAEKSRPLTIVLLDRSAPPGCEVQAPLVETVRAGASKIRNLPLQSIVSLLSRGRAGLRLRYSWPGRAPVLASHMGPPLVDAPITPEGDSFILYYDGLRAMSMLTGAQLEARPGEAALLFKGEEGVHTVYGEREPALRVRFHRARTRPEVLGVLRPLRGFSVEEMVEQTRPVLRALEEASIGLLRERSPGRVIVPLSGGKDSAAAFILAVKALGPENVAAVYVDTGIDFPESGEYAHRLAERMGVELVVEHAGVDRGLVSEGMPLPHPRNRWCTGRKLEALRRAVKRLVEKGYRGLVVGDRDAESSRRSMRPPVRVDEAVGLPVLAPLKYWAGAHVEAYLHAEGVGLNRLYHQGFLRLGCYLCFALRPSWEVQLLLASRYFERIARLKPEQRPVIERFLAKARGAGDGVR